MPASAMQVSSLQHLQWDDRPRELLPLPTKQDLVTVGWADEAVLGRYSRTDGRGRSCVAMDGEGWALWEVAVGPWLRLCPITLRFC
jgi:hypothetical protein